MLDKIKQIEDIIRIYKEQGEHAVYKEFQAALHRIVESEGFKVVDSDEYEDISDAGLFLVCLGNYGLHTWEGYNEAVGQYQQIEGEE